MYKLYQRFWVMDFMISIFFYCICLTVHNSEMYLYKGEHVSVYIYIYASFPWWEKCSPTNYWSLFSEWINYTAYDTLSLLVHLNFLSCSDLLLTLLSLVPFFLLASLSFPLCLLTFIPSLLYSLFPGHFSPFLPRGKISNMFIMHLCLVFFKIHIDYVI